MPNKALQQTGHANNASSCRSGFSRVSRLLSSGVRRQRPRCAAMSRSISVGYQFEANGPNTPIEVRPPYFLLGTQSSSKRFWSIPRLREVGISQLSELGETDPVYFVGWDMLADLWREISLQQHLGSIDFDAELKAEWVSHLVYCYFLLVQTAPKESIPDFSIG